MSKTLLVEVNASKNDQDREIKEMTDVHIYMYNVRVIKKIKLQRRLPSGHELPINDPLRLCERGKIHLMMHAGKLSHGIMEPLVIGISDVIVEFLFCLLEELDLLSKLPLHLAQLDLTLDGPFLQLDHFCLHILDLLLEVDHLIAER